MYDEHFLRAKSVNNVQGLLDNFIMQVVLNLSPHTGACLFKILAQLAGLIPEKCV